MLNPASLEYFQKAPSPGRLSEPTSEGCSGSRADGHYINLQLRIDENRIQEFAYQSPRCLVAIACAGYLYKTLPGQTLEQAAAITDRTISQALGGVSPNRLIYTWMAAQALHDALLKGTPL